MGHRHLLSSSQMFETGPDQNCNHMHTEQPYANMGIVLNNVFYLHICSLVLYSTLFISEYAVEWL